MSLFLSTAFLVTLKKAFLATKAQVLRNINRKGTTKSYGWTLRSE